MFERFEKVSGAKFESEADEETLKKWKEAEEYFQQSIKFTEQGDPENATKTYLKALDIQV